MLIYQAPIVVTNCFPHKHPQTPRARLPTHHTHTITHTQTIVASFAASNSRFDSDVFAASRRSKVCRVHVGLGLNLVAIYGWA